MWKADWALDKDVKGQAAKACTAIPQPIQELRQELRERQTNLAQQAGAFTMLACSTAPFATGLGHEHPIENGFAFLTPYGLPYLAGSGVKGVLRRAAQELRDDGSLHHTEALITALFGEEEVKRPEDACRGALDCWDCFPDGDLVVEIMTPHQGGYYQSNDTPHDAGQPVPVPFLAVKTGAKFDFHIICHEQRLRGEAEILRDEKWQTWLRPVFEHAFTWLGFGAKTAVGYGAMQIDAERSRRVEQDRHERQRQQAEQQLMEEREASKTKMSPADKAIADLFDQRVDKNQDERAVLFSALKASKLGEHRVATAERLRDLMKQQGRWREKSEKKNPDKDQPYQDTLMVKKWLAP
ncbi:MAG: type III-B CRISPR module RAMP protein Cmr6 [Leptothrix ochracea]|uniref:type III-B CRISPR module RAMP protein Cmr6 n=1 Tax=Leptothrix ochracea TaxID=735331 RepID=UPI0034E24CA5